MNQLNMKGRNAIVTGGASGIGLAISRRLVQSGANVSIWDFNEKAMADAYYNSDSSDCPPVGLPGGFVSPP